VAPWGKFSMTVDYLLGSCPAWLRGPLPKNYTVFAQRKSRSSPAFPTPPSFNCFCNLPTRGLDSRYESRDDRGVRMAKRSSEGASQLGLRRRGSGAVSKGSGGSSLPAEVEAFRAHWRKKLLDPIFLNHLARRARKSDAVLQELIRHAFGSPNQQGEDPSQAPPNNVFVVQLSDGRTAIGAATPAAASASGEILP